MRCRGGRASAQRLTVKSVPDRYAHQLECRLCWYSCGMLQQKQGRACYCMRRQGASERPGCAQCQPWTQRNTAHTLGAQTGGNPYCERLRRTLPFQTLTAIVKPLRQRSAKEGPSGVVVAALVPVDWTSSPQTRLKAHTTFSPCNCRIDG